MKKGIRNLLRKNMRCPYCGNIVEPPFQLYFTARKCPYCYQRYSFYQGYKYHLRSFLFVVVYLSIVYNKLLFVFISIICWILIDVCPYKIIDESPYIFNNISTFKAKISFNYNDYNKIQLISIFKKKMILPICFNNGSNALSPMICVSLEKIKFSKSGCICEIATLPHGNKIQNDQGNNFNIYFNRQCIGNGIITENDKNTQ